MKHVRKSLLNMKVNTTRARRFRITNTNHITTKSSFAKLIIKTYFNYCLKYLYQHYGTSHLNSKFPAGLERKYLINRMVRFARHKSAENKNVPTLKSRQFSMQAVDKMLEELCVNFMKYRKGQYKRIYYWSKKEKKRYLNTHDCNLSGYGRISYKHSINNVKSITFKANHGLVHLVNNYMIHVTYFGNIQTKQSLAYLKHHKLVEVRIKTRRPNDYELQTITKLRNQKHLTRAQGDNIQGMDVNSRDDNFFDFSDGTRVSWSSNIKNKYERNDKEARQLQHYITTHDYGNDGNRKTRHAKHKLKKIKVKTANMIDEWQIHMSLVFVKKYPVLAMEKLKAFTMRISKRSKNYFLRKNTNHKLATIHPTTFRKQMEDTYQDHEALLLETLPNYTSKNCRFCNEINFKLGLQKVWTCPNPKCNKKIYRDFNSTFNIKNWSVDPTQHALWRLHLKYPNNKRFKNIKLKDLTTAF